MHLVAAAAVLAVADPERDLREEVGHGEEISEDGVMVGQPLHVERSVGLLPRVLHSIQRDLNWGPTDHIDQTNPQ